MSLLRGRFISAGSALALLLLGNPAQATVLATHNTLAEWQTGTTVNGTIDFSSLGLAPGTWSTLYMNVTGLTISGVNFVGIDAIGGYYLLPINPTGAQSFGTGTVLRGPVYQPSGSYIRVTLPASTAFAVDLATLGPDSQSFRVWLDGVDIGGPAISSNAWPNPRFWGVHTDTPFTQVRIVLNSGNSTTTQSQIDNIRYGTYQAVQETPEITSMLYMGCGIALLWLTRRRRLARA
ncbi:MAG: hypothetical protein FJW20_20530 [Acidimicrobiia bacterium]|nr:hypothetical protein [Acidimicrobiia bacterium]